MKLKYRNKKKDGKFLNEGKGLENWFELKEAISNTVYNEFNTDAIVEDPEILKDSILRLGLNWDTDRARNFINKTLWHF